MRRWATVFAGALTWAGTADAQVIPEIEAHAVSVVTGDEFVGAGVGLGILPRGRLRLSASGSVGRAAGSFAGRVELTASFLLSPFRRRGVTAYGGGGAALQWRPGDDGEFLLAVLGVESAPAAGSGWFAEVGVGGGARVAVGVRLRRSASR